MVLLLGISKKFKYIYIGYDVEIIIIDHFGLWDNLMDINWIKC